MPARHWTFPRTMTRGKFAGQTFESQAAYQKAARGGEPRRRPRRRKVEDLAPVLNGTPVRRILETYEELRAAGLGPSKAARLTERLLG